MSLVNVLIPTYRRKTALAVTLAGLFGQTFRDFDVVIADQTEEDELSPSQEIQTIVRAFQLRGQKVRIFTRRPRLGLAEQRHFLLGQSSARYVHFVDDDVLLEPDVMQRMLAVIQTERCGFVGCAAIGLSHVDDYRPHQHNIEVWEGPVKPEPFTPDTVPWNRHKVNNAANALHLAQKLAPDGNTVRYKVAWVGGANVLFDRDKLLDVGGFSWWSRLPAAHAGEEVLAQFLLIRKHGGCGILPSGTYHLQLPTLVPDRETNAVSLFAELIKEQSPSEQA